jgi:phage tail P2-like protein
MNSLLPANASRLELDVERLIEGSTALPLAIATLWDPYLCPLPLLPWLAWANSVDTWNDAWPEAIKRQVVADAFEVHKYKGTPYAVQRALDSIGVKTNIQEWWETRGSGVPGTMKVLAMVNDNITGDQQGLLTAGMLKLVTEAIQAAKRGSIHFDVELGISLAESLAVCAGANPGTGIIDIDADSLGILPDAVLGLPSLIGTEHRIDCLDTDGSFAPLIPGETSLGHRLFVADHQLIISEHDFIGAA